MVIKGTGILIELLNCSVNTWRVLRDRGTRYWWNWFERFVAGNVQLNDRISVPGYTAIVVERMVWVITPCRAISYDVSEESDAPVFRVTECGSLSTRPPLLQRQFCVVRLYRIFRLLRFGTVWSLEKLRVINDACLLETSRLIHLYCMFRLESFHYCKESQLCDMYCTVHGRV